MPQTTLEVYGGGDSEAGIGDSQSQDEVTDQSEEPDAPPEPRILPFDAMRNEPLLSNVLVENYDGETDDRGFLHGFGTAYFRGDNVYTGEFMNGLMHGKGKYTWADKTTYEGDFHDNQLYGSGAYIWPDGSVYEGEVKDGLRHGKGFYQCGTIPCSYSGMWCDGKREGRGCLKYTTDGQSYYDGDWYENQRHGYGTRKYTSGNMYEGEWKNNVRHGQGTMNWYDTNKMYSGQWLNGVQHGYGEHTWFLKRIKGSQYPLRNRYVGDFVNGLRHGHGIFYYANGARYDGDWFNNMKHGKGVFVFKNGMVFKGLFDSDHMLEFPDINPSGMITPDIAAAGLPVRPKTPIAAASTSSTMSGDWAKGLDLSLNDLFDGRLVDLDQREMEIQQVHYVFLQHISKLKEIYTFYSAIGSDTTLDNTSAMTKIQFCRFLKDCKIHHYELTIPELLRMIAKDNEPAHNPWSNMLMRDFLTAIATIAYHIFCDGTCPEDQLLLPWCVTQLVTQNILIDRPSVGGIIFSKTNITLELNKYFIKIYKIFEHLSKPKDITNLYHSIKMRQFLLLMKEYQLLNEELSAEEVIKILASDHPKVLQDQFIVLEIEISFLEFVEALVLCGVVFGRNKLFDGDNGTPEASQTPRSVLSTVIIQPSDSTEGGISSQSSQEKPVDREQSLSELPSKQIEIPVLLLQASSTDDPKGILSEVNSAVGKENPNEQSDDQDDLHKQASQVNKDKQRSGDNWYIDDHFGSKMNYFFNENFLPAAEKQMLLDMKSSHA